MARGQRKAIEARIQQKQEIINALETRIEHEREELEALIREQKQKEVEPSMISLERLIWTNMKLQRY